MINNIVFDAFVSSKVKTLLIFLDYENPFQEIINAASVFSYSPWVASRLTTCTF